MENNNQTKEAVTQVPQPSAGMSQQAQLSMTPKYNGWLVSDSLVKRSLAVLGHYIIGSLLISVPFIFLGLMLGLAGA